MGVNDAAKRGAKAVPFVEGGEDLVRGDSAELDGVFGHGFEAFFELRFEGGERERGAIGPRSPWEGFLVKRMVIFHRLREIDVAGDVGALVPLLQETFKEEGGFAGASGPVEDESLGNSVVLGVIVEDCF